MAGVALTIECKWPGSPPQSTFQAGPAGHTTGIPCVCKAGKRQRFWSVFQTAGPAGQTAEISRRGPPRQPGRVGTGRDGAAEQLRHVMWNGVGEPRGTRKVLPGRRPGGTRGGNPKLHCFIHPSVHSFIHSPIHPVSLLAHGLQEAQQSHLPRHLCNRSWRVVRY